MEVLARDKFQKVENKLKDYDPESIQMRVTLNTAPENQFTVKAVLNVNGKDYFTDDTSFSLENALVNAAKEFERMLGKEHFGHNKNGNWRNTRDEKHFGLEEKIEESQAAE